MASKAKIYLYKEGNECESLTGGIRLYSNKDNGSKKFDNFVNIKYNRGSNGSSYAEGVIQANNAVDLYKFNYIFISYKVISESRLNSILFRKSDTLPTNVNGTPTNNDKYFEVIAFDTRVGEIKNDKFDIGTVENSYVSVRSLTNDAYGSATPSLDIYNIYLESKENVITIHSQSENQISFSTSNLDNLITVQKVEVLINNKVSKTYTDVFDNITYDIDNSLCGIRNNKIEIRATYSQGDGITETVSEVLTHNYSIDQLPTTTSLKQVVDTVELIANTSKIEYDTLKANLENKGVEVSEEDKMSILIDKVNLFDNYIPNPLYLYKDGDECVDVTGGWDFNVCNHSSAHANDRRQMTKNQTNFYSKLTTYWSLHYRGTTNKVDLTNYTKLKCEVVNFVKVTNSFLRLYASKNDANTSNVAPIASTNLETTSNNVIIQVDISSIKDYYNIFIGLFASSASGGKDAEATISKIWLER